MKIKAVLFDLDGTLLPIDQDNFVATYVRGLVEHAASQGYCREAAYRAVMEGSSAMQANDGSVTNEEAFFKAFSAALGLDDVDRSMFDGYYVSEFQKIKELHCGFEPRMREAVDLVKSKGLMAVLATNPMFPSVATESRMRWAGFTPEDFAHFTTYEDYRTGKPSLNYYREVLSRLSLDPAECAMIGNDVGDDMPAGELGMRTFLLTDCLINRQNKDISVYRHGSVDELIDFINDL